MFGYRLPLHLLVNTLKRIEPTTLPTEAAFPRTRLARLGVMKGAVISRRGTLPRNNRLGGSSCKHREQTHKRLHFCGRTTG